MSVGHQHKAPNLFAEPAKVRVALHRLLTTGNAPALMRRWQHLNLDCDIAYTAGYNVAGTTRFADRDFVRALYDPKYAEHIIGQPIDTGLSPDDTLECVLRHEGVEKPLMDDPANPFDLYDHHDEPGGFGAHEWATFAEHELVRRKGGTPHRYERGLERIIHYCAHKPLHVITKDYACAPYLDDPDLNARRILARYKELGVVDAGKTSKETVHYRRDRNGDRCAGCSMWQSHNRRAMLSECSLVDGLVAFDRVCDKFEPAPVTLDAIEEAARPKEQANGEQEIQSGRP